MTVELVALGDSLIEGRGDPNPAGDGWLGWVARLASRLGIPADQVLNLGAFGATAADVVARQLPQVNGLRPRLVAVGVGMNDVLGKFDGETVARSLDTIFAWTESIGAATVTSTLPDITALLPLSANRQRVIAERFAQFNIDLARVASRHGVVYLDVRDLPDATEPEHWSADRLHPGATGHARVAEIALQLLADDDRGRRR